MHRKISLETTPLSLLYHHHKPKTHSGNFCHWFQVKRELKYLLIWSCSCLAFKMLPRKHLTSKLEKKKNLLFGKSEECFLSNWWNRGTHNFHRKCENESNGSMSRRPLQPGSLFSCVQRLDSLVPRRHKPWLTRPCIWDCHDILLPSVSLHSHYSPGPICIFFPTCKHLIHWYWSERYFHPPVKFWWN